MPTGQGEPPIPGARAKDALGSAIVAPLVRAQWTTISPTSPPGGASSMWRSTIVLGGARGCATGSSTTGDGGQGLAHRRLCPQDRRLARRHLGACRRPSGSNRRHRRSDRWRNDGDHRDGRPCSMPWNRRCMIAAPERPWGCSTIATGARNICPFATRSAWRKQGSSLRSLRGATRPASPSATAMTVNVVSQLDGLTRAMIDLVSLR